MTGSANPLWTAKEAAAATRGHLLGADDWRATGVSIDTRTLRPGDLFVTLVGATNDGHDYLRAAFDKGAAAALVSNAEKAYQTGGPCLLVADTQAAMEALGQAARDRAPAKRIAVTGSVGKTSVKEMLRHVFSAQGTTHASVASYNNLWGVPLTLARMPADTQFGIFEIGMNHAGEIIPLTKQVRPDVAMITTVAPVHLEFFDGVEGIADAKAEIFQGMQDGGTAILNKDNEHFERLRAAAKAAFDGTILSFGEAYDADARLTAYTQTASGAEVEANICGTPVRFQLHLTGRHQALNAVAVLAAIAAAGADVAAAAAGLSGVRPYTGRGEVITAECNGGTITVIDESYNANPVSVAAAIGSLGQREGSGRKIAVLGDMLELGPTGPELHAGLAAELERASPDLVFLSGPLMAHLWAKLPENIRGAHAESSEKLVGPLLTALKAGDVVMVKGSLGSKMARIVEALTEKKSEPTAEKGV